MKAGPAEGEGEAEGENGRTAEKAEPVRGFAEDPNGNQNPKGYGEVIEGGEEAGVGDEGGSTVPPEKAETGSDNSQIEDDADLGDFESGGESVGGEEVGAGKQGPAEKEERVDFPVFYPRLEGFQSAISDLADSKAGICPLHVEESDPPGGGFQRVGLDDGRPGDGEGGGKKENGSKSPTLEEVAQEADVDWCEKGEKDHFVGLQVLERTEQQAIHDAVLDGSQAQAEDEEARRITAGPEEGKEDKGREPQPDKGKEGRGNAGEAGLDQAERKSPDDRNEGEVKDSAGARERWGRH